MVLMEQRLVIKLGGITVTVMTLSIALVATILKIMN